MQQWTEGGFAGAVERVQHLRRLGVSHLYTSPVTEATPGTRHGYDGVDPDRVSTQLGGQEGLTALLDALRRHDLKWLLDIVPNHVGVGMPAANPRWWSVLRDGASSPHAEFFDIDWSAADGKVVLPVLGRPLADLVNEGSVELVEQDGQPAVSTEGFITPLRPDVVPDVTGPDELALLLERQHYRLDPWAAGTRNYRVFFDVNALAAVRVEDQAIFEAVHRLPSQWLSDGSLDGLRVDHVDGLADPDVYLDRLRALLGPDRWLLVEKILIGDEAMPRRWPVDGTTGYELAGWITRVLIDPTTEANHRSLVDSYLGPQSWHDIEQASKDRAAAVTVAVDVGRLGRQIGVVDEAVAAVAASLPVYRTYLPAGGDDDRAAVTEAVRAAAERQPELADDIARVGAALLAPDMTSATDAIVRWQQLTGPVMAKGVEDTALYRYRLLGALNDVGTDPSRFGTTLAEFHRAMAERQATMPRSLSTTTTHDTKRSADVRARLAVLPGIADAWAAVLATWWPRLTGELFGLAPSAAYLLLESAVGAWPIDQARLSAYLVKAEREAGVRTAWRAPDQAFEGALAAAVAELMADRAFGPDIDRFVAEKLLEPGRINAMAQVLLRCTLPGVPDIYQGDEVWNLRLVDPDNRAPVDWEEVEAVVARVSSPDAGASSCLARMDDGDPKAFVLVRALALRARRPESFGPSGWHRPLTTAGPDGERLLGFGRGDDVVVAIPRFPERGPLGATLQLPPGHWQDCFEPGRTIEGGTTAAGDLFAEFPVALLERLD